MNIFQTDFVAVKLSVLSEELLETMLHRFSFTYIIDAEYERLDHWAKKFEQKSSLDRRELQARLIITVQAARGDAEEQLQNLADYRVLLVRGHHAYLKEPRKVTSTLLARMWETYRNVRFMGITATTMRKIRQRSSRPLLSSQVVELLGNHELDGSMLYTYVSTGELSEAAEAYLSRRKGDGPFIIPIEQLSGVRERHILVLYIDFHGPQHMLKTLEELAGQSVLSYTEKGVVTGS